MDQCPPDTAYILHARPYRETSQLVTVFGRGAGRFPAVSRASRRTRGGNPVRPFCLLQLHWRGRSELKTLTGVEALVTSPYLGGDRLYVGLYLNELLMRLLHEHEPHEVLFDRYRLLLQQLAGEGDLEPLLRIFELRLLQDLGYGLELELDMETGETVREGLYYRFVPGAGVIAAAPGDLSDGIFEGEHLLAIAAGQFGDRAVRRSAKRLTRMALVPYLGDRPLASRELFREKTTAGGRSP